VIARRCPKLRKVCLYRFGAGSLKAFLKFINQVRNLDILRLEDVYFDLEEGDDPDALQPFSTLFPKPYINHLLSLSARTHGIQIPSLRDIMYSKQLPIIPEGGFPKLRVLDISDNYWDIFQNLTDFLNSLPALETVHIDPTNALLADGRAISELLPQPVEIFTYLRTYASELLPRDDAPGPFQKRVDLERFIRKAWNEGRLHSDWYDNRSWQLGVGNDEMMSNWESREDYD